MFSSSLVFGKSMHTQRADVTAFDSLAMSKANKIFRNHIRARMHVLLSSHLVYT